MKLLMSPKKDSHYRLNGCETIELSDYKVQFIPPTEKSLACKAYSDSVSHYLFFGSLYEKSDNPARYIASVYMAKGPEALFDIDGDYVFIVIDPDSITVVSDREGLIPLYYRLFNREIVITTECYSFFDDYCESDIDYSSVYDFLRYGTLVGNHTFSNKVQLIQGGTVFRFRDGKISTDRVHFFFHDSSKEQKNIKALSEEIIFNYGKALEKRIDREPEKVAVLLSGGMDSRFVLSTANRFIKDGRLSCVIFGQNHSREVEVAKETAGLKGNRYFSYLLKPDDFLRDISEYLRISCGGDMFPQSFIISVAKKARADGITGFITGTDIETQIGGTFLPESALFFKGKLSKYITDNTKSVKMHLLGEEDLKLFCRPGVYDKLFSCRSNLHEMAKQYDDIPVRDSIQTFVQENREKRVVLVREIVPGCYLDYINPNFDIDFLNSAARIPA